MRLVTAVSAAGLLAGGGLAQEHPTMPPEEGRRIVEACVAPEDQERRMDELSPETRRAILVCSQAYAVNFLRPQLPMRVDEVTTLESVTAEGLSIVYTSRLDLDAGSLPTDIAERLGAGARRYVCAQPKMAMTISQGGSYSYVWLDRTGTLVHRAVIAEC